MSKHNKLSPYEKQVEELKRLEKKKEQLEAKLIRRVDKVEVKNMGDKKTLEEIEQEYDEQFADEQNTIQEEIKKEQETKEIIKTKPIEQPKKELNDIFRDKINELFNLYPPTCQSDINKVYILFQNWACDNLDNKYDVFSAGYQAYSDLMNIKLQREQNQRTFLKSYQEGYIILPFDPQTPTTLETFFKPLISNNKTIPISDVKETDVIGDIKKIVEERKKDGD